MVTWSSSSAGTSVLFDRVEAPASSYVAETETFAALMRSVRAVQEAAVAGKSTGPIAFTTRTEPCEHAFSISVRQAWEVVGGVYRLSVTDIRSDDLTAMI